MAISSPAEAARTVASGPAAEGPAASVGRGVLSCGTGMMPSGGEAVASGALAVGAPVALLCCTGQNCGGYRSTSGSQEYWKLLSCKKVANHRQLCEQS